MSRPRPIDSSRAPLAAGPSRVVKVQDATAKALTGAPPSALSARPASLHSLALLAGWPHSPRPPPGSAARPPSASPVGQLAGDRNGLGNLLPRAVWRLGQTAPPATPLNRTRPQHTYLASITLLTLVKLLCQKYMNGVSFYKLSFYCCWNIKKRKTKSHKQANKRMTVVNTWIILV